MARNSSGSYSLPSGNPVVSGSTVSASWANTTLNDIGAELTNSLDRNGHGAMLAPLQLTNGTSAAPAATFASEPASGRYRAGAGDIRDAVAGTDVLKLQAAGVTAMVALTASAGLTAAGLTATGTVTLPTTTTAARPTPTTLTGGSGWNFSSGGGYASYWKDATGMVHLEAVGLVGASPSGNPFSAALPAGYRPAGDVPVLAIESTSGFRMLKAIPDGTFQTSAVNGEVIWINGSWYGAA